MATKIPKIGSRKTQAGGAADVDGEVSGLEFDSVTRSTVVNRPATIRGEQRPATIRDVAALAGVSHQTVHRFLQGYQRIRPQTRERVAAALAQLDYRPNLAARSLTTGRSLRLGALTHALSEFGPGKIIQGASQAARDAGYVLDVVSLDMGDEREIEQALRVLQLHDLAGVLVLASTDQMSEAFASADFRVPTLQAGEEDERVGAEPSQLSSIGIPAAMEHLAALGHRRVMYIGGPLSWSAARNRKAAYERAVAAFGLESIAVVDGDWSARSAYDAIRVVPDLACSAVVAGNDQMALGTMLALHDRGLRVPVDVSVVGIDDIPEAEFFAPPLTTLRVDFVAQGRRAVAQLLAEVTGAEPPQTEALLSQLVVRRSTGPAPKSS